MQEMHKFRVNCVGNLNYKVVVGCPKEVIVSKIGQKCSPCSLVYSSCMKLNFDQTCGKHTCFCIQDIEI